MSGCMAWRGEGTGRRRGGCRTEAAGGGCRGRLHGAATGGGDDGVGAPHLPQRPLVFCRGLEDTV